MNLHERLRQPLAWPEWPENLPRSSVTMLELHTTAPWAVLEDREPAETDSYIEWVDEPEQLEGIGADLIERWVRYSLYGWIHNEGTYPIEDFTDPDEARRIMQLYKAEIGNPACYDLLVVP